MTDSGASPAVMLAADVGTTTTHLAMLASVEGRYRLVADMSAPTTTSQPYGDAGVALRSIMQTMAAATGWPRLAADGALQSDQALAIATVTSAPAPLRTFVISPSTARGQRIAQTLRRLGYTHIAAVLGLDDRIRGATRQETLAQQLQLIDDTQPSLIVADVTTRPHAARVAAMLRAIERPSPAGSVTLLFAGTEDVETVLRDRLPRSVTLRTLGRSPWVEGPIDRRLIEPLLAELYLAGSRATVPGLSRALSPYQRGPLLAAPSCLHDMARFLAQARGATVAVADVGGRSTAALVCAPDAPAGSKGTVATPASAIISDQGVGVGLDEVLRDIAPESVLHWLPFDVGEDELRNYLANRWLRDKLVPADMRQLLIEQAVMRACLLTARGGPNPGHYDMLIATGGVARQPRPGQTALLLLDTFQPLSLTRLLADSSSLLSRLGALARLDADAALSVVQHDTLIDLGPCLSVTGEGKEGDTVGHIELRDTESGTPRDYDVRFGTVQIVPLGPGTEATVQITAQKRFTFAVGPRATESQSLTLSGGLLGLIIDARGRPLTLSADVTQRQARIMDWLQAVDAVASDVFSTLG